MSHNFPYILLILLPMVAAPLVYLIGRATLRKGEIWGMTFARLFTVVVLILAGIALYFTTQSAVSGGSINIQVGSVFLMFDGMGLLVDAVVIALALFVAIFSTKYMEDEDGEEKFYALLLICVGSIIGLAGSFDLFNLWVWFEVMAVSTYFLVAFYHDETASLEAGMKYLVQSTLGSTMVLFGIALIYSQTGSVAMADVYRSLANPLPLVGLGGLLMMVGFGVKAAFVPLHTWLPDAHSQAPSGISAMLSGVVIEAGLVAMLRMISILGHANIPWGLILLAFGCLNIFLGNLMALRQTQVKRLLAYSSLAHVGYMLLGFGFSMTFKIMEGAQGAFFHMMTHAMMKGLAFLAAGALLYALFLSRGEHSALTLDDLNGASRKYPITAFAFSAAVLGLGGLPPMAGFMSKWQILLAGAGTQNTVMIIIVIFAALNSVLSLGYYAPMVNRIYRREPSDAVTQGKPITWQMALPMVLMVLIIVLMGVYPKAVEFLTSNAAYSLMAIFAG
ncbi:MAG: proton-conducting transporter membrane subunit [Anaerolineaceae bacterium]